MDGSVEINTFQSAKVPVINKKDYRVFFQLLSLNDTQLMFVHCDVFNWSKDIAVKLNHDFNALCSLYGGPLFALNDLEDEKHRKFLTLYDFKPLQEVTGEDGVRRNLFIRTRK